MDTCSAAAVCWRRDVRFKRELKRVSQRMPFRPLLRFLYVYVWQMGFLDGRQGYYFARPGMAAVPQALCDNMFAGLLGDYQPVRTGPSQATNLDLDTYARALNLAILDLQRGASFAQATESFLSLPQVLRVCLATADAGMGSTGSSGSRLVLDLIETPAANLATTAPAESGTVVDQLQQVLQQALSAPHQVHITAQAAPASARGAITLSCAFELEQRMVVLCGDLADRRHRAVRGPADNDEQRSPGNVIRLHL